MTQHGHEKLFLHSLVLSGKRWQKFSCHIKKGTATTNYHCGLHIKNRTSNLLAAPWEKSSGQMRTAKNIKLCGSEGDADRGWFLCRSWFARITVLTVFGKKDLSKQCRLFQTLQNVASDQVLHILPFIKQFHIHLYIGRKNGLVVEKYKVKSNMWEYLG